MKVKTVVTLPKDLMLSIDALTDKKHKRSAVIECALREYIAREKPKSLNKRDMEIINKNSELINQQVSETLEFQAEW
jgi:metal-responsive CopG/Arc/MetJ family transcriptional regulator